MNADRLLAHYERIADAPDAIARLRRFILELAVRGKLVPQDASDESTSTALRRIKAHGLLDGAFPLPASWAWIDVATVADTRLGKMLDKAKNKGLPRPYLRNINVRWFDFDLSDLLEMPFEDSELSEFTLRRGDVLICEGGEPGRAAVWDDRAQGIYFQKAIHRVRFAPLVDSVFFVYVLKASADDGRLAESFTGTGIKHFTGRGLNAYAVPLPPLAEQRRIVGKVDELMGLCDRLEAARGSRERMRDRLAAASIARLNAPDSETFQADARFALDALPALTTRPDQIRQVRQTILNLAVRGKLVAQDAKDEPASDLLKRIAKEKARLVKAGEIRKSHPLPPISKDELPFDLPGGWAWTRLGDLVHLVSGQHLQPPEYSEDPTVGLPYITGPSDFASEGLQITRFALVRKAVAKKGQLLLTVKGSGVGKTTICDIPEVAISRQLMALTAIEWDDRFLLLITHRLAERLREEARSLIPGISREDVDEFVFPLPPLAEQHRIVATVDALMALCDRLEASLTTTAATRRRLLDALLAEALAPAEDREREAAE
ncbi:restriction endonuclease subunit S [Mesorhizobium sp. M0134]|uniref:restriction endonuclease subunit S n=1 Tax=Mesorhizobium sp. M0134 TaxID=2956889 RepID=UPI0033394509